MSYIGNKPHQGRITGGNIVDGSVTEDDLNLDSLNVDGTVTADGLTVDGDATFSSSASSFITFPHNGFNYIDTTGAGSALMFRMGSTPINTMRLSSNGDVQWYEDTGTTAKMTWDSSAENLTIDSSGIFPLSLDSSGSETILKLDNSSTNGRRYWLISGGSGGSFAGGKFGVYDADSLSVPFLIDSSGNVGIGTSSPSSKLTINGGDTAIRSGGKAFYWNSGNTSTVWTSNDNGSLAFGTGSHTERARIDASGNLLVGTTAQYGATGVTLQSDGLIYARRNNAPAYLRRDGGEGDIIYMEKDGELVGAIGCGTGAYDTNIYIGRGDTCLIFQGQTNNSITPWNGGSNSNSDNSIDLGSSTARFDDIYATNGTIQTSDRNEKQDIEELSEAEQRVAQACKGLIRKFRWKDAVESKGEDARIHFGVIAQDVQDAFTAEGLDASDYALFISNTWYEKTIHVDAVEAQEAVLDEDGNVITEAVEAKEAYSYVDTKDEPTEGYTERTRLGIRYSELLAFIIGGL